MTILLNTANVAIARIAILGAESSGKSQLASALARQYQSCWVPEYLREFVDARQRPPHEHEQLQIAQIQLEREQRVAEQGEAAGQQWLFCDTTPVMTLLYSQHYWNRVPVELEQLTADHAARYALTLVTAPDGLWVPDGLQRESAIVQQTIHALLLTRLTMLDISWQLVTGTLAQRLQQVQQALEAIAKLPPCAGPQHKG